jgi:hypothetical protein
MHRHDERQAGWRSRDERAMRMDQVKLGLVRIEVPTNKQRVSVDVNWIQRSEWQLDDPQTPV